MGESLEKCSDRPHTPIVSEAQRGLFGSELARRRKGEEGRMKGITVGELEGHLKEAGGKNLSKASGAYAGAVAMNIMNRVKPAIMGKPHHQPMAAHSTPHRFKLNMKKEQEGIDMGKSVSSKIKEAVKPVKADPAFKENLRQRVTGESPAEMTMRHNKTPRGNVNLGRAQAGDDIDEHFDPKDVQKAQVIRELIMKGRYSKFPDEKEKPPWGVHNPGFGAYAPVTGGVHNPVFRYSDNPPKRDVAKTKDDDAKVMQDWHDRSKKDMAAWKPLPDSKQAPVSAFGQTKVDPDRDYVHDRADVEKMKLDPKKFPGHDTTLLQPLYDSKSKPSAIEKSLVIVDLVKTSGVPAGWVGKSAKCPHCDSEVMQSHPMQTLHKQMHNHLRKAHGMTHAQASNANPVSMYGISKGEQPWQTHELATRGSLHAIMQDQRTLKREYPQHEYKTTRESQGYRLHWRPKGDVMKASDADIEAEKKSIAKRFPHGVYWSGKQGQDPGARLRQMISEKEISKASDDVMEAEREKISREHPQGVNWDRVVREGARGRDPSARLRQLVNQRMPAANIPKKDRYDPKRGGE